MKAGRGNGEIISPVGARIASIRKGPGLPGEARRAGAGDGRKARGGRHAGKAAALAGDILTAGAGTIRLAEGVSLAYTLLHFAIGPACAILAETSADFAEVLADFAKVASRKVFPRLRPFRPQGVEAGLGDNEQILRAAKGIGNSDTLFIVGKPFRK